MKNNFTLYKVWNMSIGKGLLFLQVLLNFAVSFISIQVSDFANKVVDGKIIISQNRLYILYFGSYIILGFILSFFLYFVRNDYAIRTAYDLRNKGMKKLLTASYGYIDQNHSGVLMSKLSHDISKVSDYISSGLPDFMNCCIVFLCSFCYLISINLRILIICMLVMPLVLYIPKKFSHPTYDSMNVFKRRLDEAHVMIKDSVHNVEVEKSYNLQDIRIRKFNKKIDEAIDSYVKYEKYVAKASPIKYIIDSVPAFMCIIICLVNAYFGKITNGELVAFVLLLGNITSPMSQFITYWLEYKEVQLSLERVLEILSVKDEDGRQKNDGTEYVLKEQQDMRNNQSCFEFKKVSFAYGKNTVLQNLSFNINKGEKVAIVGESGSGKSTLFKLLVGLYEPSKGEISLYDNNMRNIAIDDLRSRISYVEQNTFLFDGNIEDNIRGGNKNADLKEIVQAARKAYAHEFIMKLPNGYETRVSEGGANLSGGQKQRIALARAFLKDSPILLLDEVTSALDVESEEMIKKAILEHCSEKTVIIITHRMLDGADVNQVFVMRKGEIVEKQYY